MKVLRIIEGVEIPPKKKIAITKYLFDEESGFYYIKSPQGYYLDYLGFQHNTAPIFCPKMKPLLEIYVAIEEEYKSRILFEVNDDYELRKKTNQSKDKFEYYIVLLYKKDIKEKIILAPALYKYVAEVQEKPLIKRYSYKYYDPYIAKECIRRRIQKEIIREYFYVCFSQWWRAIKFLYQYCYRKKEYPDLLCIHVNQDGYWVKIKLSEEEIKAYRG